jgi:hypothetical protein
VVASSVNSANLFLVCFVLCVTHAQDNSDPQYRSFRNNLSTLCKAAFAYLIIKFVARKIIPTNQLRLMPLNIILSLTTLVALHGASALKVLMIMGLNFFIPKAFKGSLVTPILTWVFNGFVLFMNVTFHGYPFEDVFPPLAFLVRSPNM